MHTLKSTLIVALFGVWNKMRHLFTWQIHRPNLQ